MVGWIPISAGNASLSQVAFGLVRLHANINQPYANRNYTFDPTVDVLPLAYNTFSVYDPYFKYVPNTSLPSPSRSPANINRATQIEISLNVLALAYNHSRSHSRSPTISHSPTPHSHSHTYTHLSFLPPSCILFSFFVYLRKSLLIFYLRPQLHYRNTTNTLIIVDPATDSIYTVAVGPGTFPMSAGIAQRVSPTLFLSLIPAILSYSAVTTSNFQIFANFAEVG
jgi:hypothetical protein